MAVTFSSSSTLFLILFLLHIATNISTATTSSHEELETALRSLHSHGYRLFTNAITTSEIKFQLLSSTTTAAAPQFTLFAPRDGPIYDLDMTADATDYVTTLRYHVIPDRRLTFSDLQNLTSPFLSTLLPHFSILIGKTFGGDSRRIVGVMVNGGRISHPDLFIGPNLVVHGITGILSTDFSLQHEDLIEAGSGHFSPAGSPQPVEAVSPMSNHSGSSNSSVAAPIAPISRNVPVNMSPGGGQRNVNNRAPVTRNIPVKKSPAGRQQNVNRRPRRRGHGQGRSQRRHRQQPRNHEL